MATTKTSLTSAAWSDLGTTPCTIQLIGGRDVLFVIDTVAPGSLSADAHRLSLGGSGQREAADIGFASKLYARAEGGGADVVVSR